jgi:dienelactone hydrolase
MPIADFAQWSFTQGDITHEVYTRGFGPVVVLMHELPGMTPACITFADELVARGFRVSMPLLFGEPGDNRPGFFWAKLCISKEFRALRSGVRRPISEWLRALCRKLKSEAGVAGIGLIGMCLTGNFAISMMADDSVLAPVSAQPALPWCSTIFSLSRSRRMDIDVDAAELTGAQARNRAGIPLMCLRFSDDKISPAQRFEAIRQAFAANFLPHVIDSSPGNPDGIAADAHSVLTGDFHDQSGHPTRKARDDVIAFLTRSLTLPRDTE